MPLCTPHSALTIPSLRSVGFWRAFDSLSTGKALLAVWRSLFGKDFAGIKPFLQPTTEHSLLYPCTADPWCECDHEVSEDTEWEQVGVCTCGDCEPIPLTRQDTVLYALNRRAFAEALRQALGFAPPALSTLNPQPSTPLELGLYAPVHAPVHFHAPTSTPGLLAAIHTLITDRPGPFLLLTPTPTFHTAATTTVLNRATCAHVALSAILDPASLSTPPSTMNPQLSTVLAAWGAAVASRPGPTVLEALHREIAAVRKDFGELRTAKQRLEQMQAEGMFAFTRKVDATSFKVLCAVLAQGDVAKAGRTLGISDPMMRKIMRQWRDRGPAYQAMLDMVRWRKRVGRKQTLALNDSIIQQHAETTDYPGLLSDILDGLLSMTENNWQDLCEDLAARLRPVIAAATQLNPARPTPARGGQ